LLTHKLDTQKLNAEFESKNPQEIIAWAIREFSQKIAMTSSFGSESGVLLHMVSEIDSNFPVLFIETGFHFPETIEYKEKLVKLFGLTNVIDLHADSKRREELIEKHDGIPYEKNPDLCCQINKVESLDEALKNYDAWMSGIRQHQTDLRKSVRFVEEYEGDLYKISPLARYTSRDCWWYLKEHKIPKHPLYDKGFLSIGCWPCTKPVQEGDDERSGRWAGREKKECGIHRFKEVKAKEKGEIKIPKDLSPNI